LISELYFQLMNKLTDIQLFNTLKSGNKIALGELFNRYYDDLKHYGMYIANDPTIAEDCIQELFIYIFEARSRLADVKNVKSYLFTALRRRLIENVDKRKAQELRNQKIVQHVDIKFTPQDLIESREHTKLTNLALIKALNNLSDRKREAIYLRYFNSLTTNEISLVMGISNQTVLNMLYQGLKQIRKDEYLRGLLS